MAQNKASRTFCCGTSHVVARHTFIFTSFTRSHVFITHITRNMHVHIMCKHTFHVYSHAYHVFTHISHANAHVTSHVTCTFTRVVACHTQTYARNTHNCAHDVCYHTFHVASHVTCASILCVMHVVTAHYLHVARYFAAQALCGPISCSN